MRIGEDSYSIKSIEALYRPKRRTDVTTASGSIVQYANWMAFNASPARTKQPRDWQSSNILKGIRDYNEDDCKSNAELCEWLRNLAKEQGVHCDVANDGGRGESMRYPGIQIRHGASDGVVVL